MIGCSTCLAVPLIHLFRLSAVAPVWLQHIHLDRQSGKGSGKRLPGNMLQEHTNNQFEGADAEPVAELEVDTLPLSAVNDLVKDSEDNSLCTAQSTRQNQNGARPKKGQFWMCNHQHVSRITDIPPT